MNPTVAAFFDVDGTVARTDIVRSYIHLRTCRMSAPKRWLWLATYLPKVVYLVVLDRLDRTRMNRVFYRGYRGLDSDRLYPLRLQADLAEVAGRLSIGSDPIDATDPMDVAVAAIDAFMQRLKKEEAIHV